MAISKRNASWLLMAIFIGIIAGLVISANFDFIFKGLASSDKPSEKNVNNSDENSSKTRSIPKPR